MFRHLIIPRWYEEELFVHEVTEAQKHCLPSELDVAWHSHSAQAISLHLPVPVNPRHVLLIEVGDNGGAREGSLDLFMSINFAQK